MSNPQREEQLRVFRLLLFGRSATIAAMFGGLFAIDRLATPLAGTEPLLAFIAFLLLLSPLHYLIGLRLLHEVCALSLAVVLLDTVLMPGGLYLLGGQNVAFGLPFYGVLIAMAASIHSRRAAYGVAMLAVGGHALLAGSIQAGWIAPYDGLTPFAREGSWNLSAAIGSLFVCLAMAVVTGGLTAEKRRALDRSRRAESELEDLNAALERRVTDAVAELHAINETLVVRNTELAAASHQLELFAAAVSHDLRSPMTAASEALSLLPGCFEPGQLELIGLARHNLERADAMMVGLRDLMRAAGERRSLHDVNVQSVVESVVEDLRAERLGGAPPLKIESDLGTVLAGEGELEHVFHNLITNALDANRGRADLLIRVGRLERDGVAVFYVADNGAGVDPLLRPRVFEPFRRGRNAASGGLGLGLALVRAIVGHAGGQVRLEPGAGEGAMFVFTWPRGTSAA